MTTYGNHKSSSDHCPTGASPAVASALWPIKFPSLTCKHESEGDEHEDTEDNVLHDEADPQDIKSCPDSLILLIGGLTLAAQLANQEENADALYRKGQHI